MKLVSTQAAVDLSAMGDSVKHDFLFVVVGPKEDPIVAHPILVKTFQGGRQSF